MRFGSVCSGIEAASVAWGPLGWNAAWFSEIEPFPCALLAHHYPDTPNLGDMTNLPALIALGEVESPDVLCGGTPCQAFSVAGLRRSLDDARGNLSLTFCEIANAIDDRRRDEGCEPCIVFWENVPGVLNTKDNAFGCFLAGLAGEDDALVPPGGRWSDAGCVLGPERAVAWRTLDAQYFGLAQRRRRVFVVASARDDFDPAAVLFELDGVRRDSAPSREAGEGTAQCLTAGTGKRYDPETETILPHTGRAGVEPVAFHHNAQAAQLQTIDRDTSVSGSLTCPQQAAIAFSSKDHGADATADLAPTLRAMNHAGSHANGGGQMAVAVDVYNHTIGGELAATLNAESGAPNHSGPKLLQSMRVRRLTPRECERLQGFPDDYTLTPYRNKPAADGPRYKALGNSWAVPVVRWIGWRIDVLAGVV